MIRGNKGYAYWTLVVGVVVLLGEWATVVKAYDRMTSQGDRDQVRCEIVSGHYVIHIHFQILAIFNHSPSHPKSIFGIG